MTTQSWYSAQTIYKHKVIECGVLKSVFEERIVLFQGLSFEDVIAKAEAEATEYCRNLPDCEYLGYVVACHIHDGPLEHGTEAFSLMRDSTLSDREYITRFYDSGNERQQTMRG